MSSQDSAVTPLTEAEREAEWRLREAEEAWLWHEADDERTAGYGHHMAQMLYRLPRDGQTTDMRLSIEGILADCRALAARTADLAAQVARVEALADEWDAKLRRQYDSGTPMQNYTDWHSRDLRAALAPAAQPTPEATT